MAVMFPEAGSRAEGPLEMKIGIPTEVRPGETRVAATPETVKKYCSGGQNTVFVQAGAGAHSNFPDADYAAAGATVVADAASVYAQSELVLKVRSPLPDEVQAMKSGTVLIGLLTPYDTEGNEALAKQGLTAFAMELLPRTSRAQSMDVLSSQANIAGYKAVVLGADTYGRIMPMLMTAAGTLKAARVVILGAGVAGLQAIATAKRLGAVIEASDVRPAVKEQIESLGAKFIDVPYETDEEREIAQGVGGYARPMPASWMTRQAAEVAKRIALADIVITTALIPGRKAPVLVTDAMVKSMKPGSVIVDMAVEQGGNVEGSKPGEIVISHGVRLVGETNLPALVPTDSSSLYSRNLMTFLALMLDNKTGQFNLNREDDLVAGTLLCHGGELARKQ